MRGHDSDTQPRCQNFMEMALDPHAGSAMTARGHTSQSADEPGWINRRIYGFSDEEFDFSYGKARPCFTRGSPVQAQA